MPSLFSGVCVCVCVWYPETGSLAGLTNFPGGADQQSPHPCPGSRHDHLHMAAGHPFPLRIALPGMEAARPAGLQLLLPAAAALMASHPPQILPFAGPSPVQNRG